MSEMEFDMAAVPLQFGDDNKIYFGQGKAIELTDIVPSVDISDLKLKLAQAQTYESTLDVLKANGIDTKNFIEQNSPLMILTSKEGIQITLNVDPDQKLTLDFELDPDVALQLQDMAVRDSGISMKDIEEFLVSHGLLKENRDGVVHTDEEHGFVHEDANMSKNSLFGVGDKSMTEEARDVTQEEMYRRRQRERNNELEEPSR